LKIEGIALYEAIIGLKIAQMTDCKVTICPIFFGFAEGNEIAGVKLKVWVKMERTLVMYLELNLTAANRAAWIVGEEELAHFGPFIGSFHPLRDCASDAINEMSDHKKLSVKVQAA
jgi:hypothetical protein